MACTSASWRFKDCQLVHCVNQCVAPGVGSNKEYILRKKAQAERAGVFLLHSTSTSRKANVSRKGSGRVSVPAAMKLKGSS